MNVNSNGYTYTFATVMVVLVAVLLSGFPRFEIEAGKQREAGKNAKHLGFSRS